MSSRRHFISIALKSMAGLSLASVFGFSINKLTKKKLFWQIDPYKCTQCGLCQTECVIAPSAVKCFHAFDVCGYCELCGGYHHSQASATDSAAENQLCPTAAIQRTFIEDPYYQYSIDQDLCIGCAKCVKGCNDFGNGSLFLQIRRDLCLDCNECAIAKACPSHAISKTTAEYILKGASA